jgi:hypothetical protein
VFVIDILKTWYICHRGRCYVCVKQFYDWCLCILGHLLAKYIKIILVNWSSQ